MRTFTPDVALTLQVVTQQEVGKIYENLCVLFTILSFYQQTFYDTITFRFWFNTFSCLGFFQIPVSAYVHAVRYFTSLMLSIVLKSWS